MFESNLRTLNSMPEGMYEELSWYLKVHGKKGIVYDLGAKKRLICFNCNHIHNLSKFEENNNKCPSCQSDKEDYLYSRRYTQSYMKHKNGLQMTYVKKKEDGTYYLIEKIFAVRGNSFIFKECSESKFLENGNLIGCFGNTLTTNIDVNGKSSEQVVIKIYVGLKNEILLSEETITKEKIVEALCNSIDNISKTAKEIIEKSFNNLVASDNTLNIDKFNNYLQDLNLVLSQDVKDVTYTRPIIQFLERTWLSNLKDFDVKEYLSLISTMDKDFKETYFDYGPVFENYKMLVNTIKLYNAIKKKQLTDEEDLLYGLYKLVLAMNINDLMKEFLTIKDHISSRSSDYELEVEDLVIQLLRDVKKYQLNEFGIKELVAINYVSKNKEYKKLKNKDFEKLLKDTSKITDIFSVSFINKERYKNYIIEY